MLQRSLKSVDTFQNEQDYGNWAKQNYKTEEHDLPRVNFPLQVGNLIFCFINIDFKTVVIKEEFFEQLTLPFHIHICLVHISNSSVTHLNYIKKFLILLA